MFIINIIFKLLLFDFKITLVFVIYSKYKIVDNVILKYEINKLMNTKLINIVVKNIIYLLQHKVFLKSIYF